MINVLTAINSKMVVVHQVDGVWTQALDGVGTAVAILAQIANAAGLYEGTVHAIGTLVSAPDTSVNVPVSSAPTNIGSFTGLLEAKENDTVMATIFCEEDVYGDNYLQEDTYKNEAERTILGQYKKRT